MKKLFSVLLACVVALTSLCSTASAEMVGENGYLGVIINADGEIVSYVPMPVTRQTKVDTGVTLGPNESFISYQYVPKYAFGVGMRFTKSNGTQTTRNRTLLVQIFQSPSSGGTRYLVAAERYSTNKEDHDSADIIDDTVSFWCEVSSIRPYYNAKFTNVSSSTGYFNIVVYMD